MLITFLHTFFICFSSALAKISINNFTFKKCIFSNSSIKMITLFSHCIMQIRIKTYVERTRSVRRRLPIGNSLKITFLSCDEKKSYLIQYWPYRFTYVTEEISLVPTSDDSTGPRIDLLGPITFLGLSVPSSSTSIVSSSTKTTFRRRGGGLCFTSFGGVVVVDVDDVVVDVVTDVVEDIEEVVDDVVDNEALGVLAAEEEEVGEEDEDDEEEE